MNGRQSNSIQRLHQYHRTRASAKAPLGEALGYISNYWAGLVLFLADGRIELDSNAVERTIRQITIRRKNFLFAGSDEGGETLADAMTIIVSAKLHDLNPPSRKRVDEAVTG